MLIELCPAIRARVHASQPDAPRRVRNVCRPSYSKNGTTARRGLPPRSAPRGTSVFDMGDIEARLDDLGDGRIALMDESGVDVRPRC
jgi:hypothetical protein